MIDWVKQVILFDCCQQLVSTDSTKRMELRQSQFVFQEKNTKSKIHKSQSYSSQMQSIKQRSNNQSNNNFKSTEIGSGFSETKTQTKSIAYPKNIKNQYTSQFVKYFEKSEKLSQRVANSQDNKSLEIKKQDQSSSSRITQKKLGQSSMLNFKKLGSIQAKKQSQPYLLQNLPNKYYWIDPQIYNGQNQTYLSELSLSCDISGYSSYQSVKMQLDDQPQDFKCQLICAASLSDQDYKQMRVHSKIVRIILFCQNQERSILLMKNFPKISVVHYKIATLIQEVKKTNEN